MLKIMLWKNSFGAKAMSHPGHVALAIGQGGKPDHYISYWPVANSSGTPVSARPAKFNRFAQDLMAELGSNARTRLQAGSTPRPGQANDNVIDVDGFTVDNPQNVWVKMPDETFDIPIADSQNGVGLSQEHIVDWWKLFSTDLGYKHQYRFISRKINCASIVMSALTVGGARMFVKPDRQFMYYSPTTSGSMLGNSPRKSTRCGSPLQSSKTPRKPQASPTPWSIPMALTSGVLLHGRSSAPCELGEGTVKWQQSTGLFNSTGILVGTGLSTTATRRPWFCIRSLSRSKITSPANPRVIAERRSSSLAAASLKW